MTIGVDKKESLGKWWRVGVGVGRSWERSGEHGTKAGSLAAPAGEIGQQGCSVEGVVCSVLFSVQCAM